MKMSKSVNQVVDEFENILAKHRVKKTECSIYEDAILGYQDIIFDTKEAIESIWDIPEESDWL